jgi:DNA helicase-2/ATP-dependent DNA helicase PcrA
LIKLRPNRLGEAACAKIYELARSDGTTFYEAIRRITEAPSLLERQGHLVRNEYDSILAILSELQGQDQEDMTHFIGSMIERNISVDKHASISETIEKVLRESSASSVPDLLRGLTNPIRDTEQAKVPACINIMTMHQAKGLDSQAVFVVGAEEEYIPGRAEGAAIDDERRLLYVSLTRARTHLFITHCSQRTGGQRHTGRTSGSTARNLTQFLSGGPIRSQPASGFLDSLSG